MVRYHTDKNGNTPFTPEEEAEQDAIEASWEAGAEERVWEQIRSQRDELLTASDWRFVSDTPSAHASQAWKTYRQELRDVTGVATPADVIWPDAPA